MDVSDPATALAGGLTMPILRALAGRSSPATAAQVYRIAQHGTEAGIRRAIERLATKGVVWREQVGDRVVYSLNYDHVLEEAVRALLRAPEELPRRLRERIGEWSVPPVSAALYGSAARRDGDNSSDIDILLVRPSLTSASQRQAWSQQVDDLRDSIRRWTGNNCQITDRSLSAIRRLVSAKEPIMESWRADAVVLAGTPLDEVLSAA